MENIRRDTPTIKCIEISLHISHRDCGIVSCDSSLWCVYAYAKSMPWRSIYTNIWILVVRLPRRDKKRIPFRKEEITTHKRYEEIVLRKAFVSWLTLYLIDSLGGEEWPRHASVWIIQWLTKYNPVWISWYIIFESWHDTVSINYISRAEYSRFLYAQSTKGFSCYILIVCIDNSRISYTLWYIYVIESKTIRAFNSCIVILIFIITTKTFWKRSCREFNKVIRVELSHASLLKVSWSRKRKKLSVVHFYGSRYKHLYHISNISRAWFLRIWLPNLKGV